MRAFPTRLALAAAMLASLAACGTVADTVSGSIAVAAVDQTISRYVEKECRLAELLRTGTLCTVPSAQRGPAPVYCFRTLGAVDCYGGTDPFALDAVARTGSPDPLNDPLESAPAPRTPPQRVVSASAPKPPLAGKEARLGAAAGTSER